MREIARASEGEGVRVLGAQHNGGGALSGRGAVGRGRQVASGVRRRPRERPFRVAGAADRWVQRYIPGIFHFRNTNRNSIKFEKFKTKSSQIWKNANKIPLERLE